MNERMALAERQLDRMQSFFPRIDAKITAVAAWLSVEIAVAGLNTKLSDLRAAYVWVPFVVFLITTGWSGSCVWRCLFPDRKGGQGSLIYFGSIANRTEGSFQSDFKAASDGQLLDDVLGQVWRNAEIVCDKYIAVQSSIRWATVSLLSLIVTLVATSILHGALPSFPGG